MKTKDQAGIEKTGVTEGVEAAKVTHPFLHPSASGKAGKRSGKNEKKPRERDGIFTVKDGRRTVYVARVRVTDSTGQRRELKRYCDSYNGAKDARKALKDEARKIKKGLIVLSAPRTMGELCDVFEAQVLNVAPRYDEKTGAKIGAGYVPALVPKLKAFMKTFCAHFGEGTKIRTISPAMLVAYREARLRTPITRRYSSGPFKGEPFREHGKRKRREVEAMTREEREALALKQWPRSVAVVNRELSFLRRLFAFAVECGSIEVNPFGRKSRLISAEVHKTRTLSLEDEARLILAAGQEERAHLKPLLVLLLETGLRISEALALRWEDVHLSSAKPRIDILPENTKTRQARVVPVSSRLSGELSRIREGRIKGRVFGSLTTVQRSFRTACRLSGIEGLRIHDLRHTAGSRLAARLPIVEVANILGHKDLETTRRYLNMTDERLQRASEALDSFRSEETAKIEERNRANGNADEKVN